MSQKSVGFWDSMVTKHRNNVKYWLIWCENALQVTWVMRRIRTREMLAQNNQRSAFNKDANEVWRIYDNHTSLRLDKMKVTKHNLWQFSFLFGGNVGDTWMFESIFCVNVRYFDRIYSLKPKTGGMKNSDSKCANVWMCFHPDSLLSPTRKGSNSRCKWLGATNCSVCHKRSCIHKLNGSLMNAIMFSVRQSCFKLMVIFKRMLFYNLRKLLKAVDRNKPSPK